MSNQPTFLSAVPSDVMARVPADGIVFPGLFNAHDHLDFNLFPFLATRAYDDCTEWGKDIHEHFHEVIQRVEQIPFEQRVRFGLLKNLLQGVTRVVHHGRDQDRIAALTSFPVLFQYQYLDSIATEPWWKIKLNLPFTDAPMIHVGEGTSERAKQEIHQLLKWNKWGKALTGIHAIGISAEEAKQFAALVWCPDANLKLYGDTMKVTDVMDATTLWFGTDSTVSASANLYEQLRNVRKKKLMADIPLLNMLTGRDTRSNNPQPIIYNDWVIARRKHDGWMDSFYDLNPEDILQVIIAGKTWLSDQDMSFDQRPPNAIAIEVAGRVKWVAQDLGCVVDELGADWVLPLGIQKHRP